MYSDTPTPNTAVTTSSARGTLRFSTSSTPQTNAPTKNRLMSTTPQVMTDPKLPSRLK